MNDFNMIYEKLVKFLRKDMHVTEEITYSSTFKDDLGIDSLNIVDLIFFIEGEFLNDEAIPEKDFEVLMDVQSAINYIIMRNTVEV